MEENQVPTGSSVPNSVSFPGSVPSTPRKRGSKWIYIVIVFVIIIVVIAFLVFKGSQAPSGEGETLSGTSQLTESGATATPTPEPTSTPASQNKDEVRVQILNGTGIPGEAAYLQNQLKPLGYTDITVGNADSATNTTTSVTFASEVSQSIMTEITNKLKSIYETVQTDTSRSLTSTDIQIITGLKKGSTPKPAETAAPSPTPTP